jgi:hypothetical protein
VRLSPKARKRVTLRRGGAVTVTLNLQTSVRATLSVAVQLTVVTPIGNIAPLAGEQDTVVGGVPPVAVAALYEIASDSPDSDGTVIGAGQNALGDSNNCVGRNGVSLHPCSKIMAWATPASTARILEVEREVRRTAALPDYDPSSTRVKMAAGSV